MSNSPLVVYTKLSPNCSKPRKHEIDTITIHCVVGQCSVETVGNVFYPRSRNASSNYGVGPDGRIGMYCEECNRSWCSSSSSNDNRAITIEVASDRTHPYAVKDAAYEGLIKLLVDICQRNSALRGGLRWKADKSLIGQVDKQNMSVHRWFANKACPGDYLYNRHGAIATEVNKRLGLMTSANDAQTVSTNSPTASNNFSVGDIVRLSNDAVYYTGRPIASWVRAKEWVVSAMSGSRVVLGKSADGKNNINSPVDAKYLISNQTTSTNNNDDTNASYLVKIMVDTLDVKCSAESDGATTTTVNRGEVYTIVETKDGWGKLKSGAGWILLDSCQKIEP